MSSAWTNARLGSHPHIMIHKVEGDKLITYYEENASFYLIEYDTITGEHKQLGRFNERETVEQVIANR